MTQIISPDIFFANGIRNIQLIHIHPNLHFYYRSQTSEFFLFFFSSFLNPKNTEMSHQLNDLEYFFVWNSYKQFFLCVFCSANKIVLLFGNVFWVSRRKEVLIYIRALKSTEVKRRLEVMQRKICNRKSLSHFNRDLQSSFFQLSFLSGIFTGRWNLLTICCTWNLCNLVNLSQISSLLISDFFSYFSSFNTNFYCYLIRYKFHRKLS